MVFGWFIEFVFVNIIAIVMDNNTALFRKNWCAVVKITLQY